MKKAILVMGLIGCCAAAEPRHRNIHEGLVGFSGQVQGKVVEGRKKNAFMFSVTRVLRTWKNNEAGAPKRLEGMTVPVAPNWRKGEDGRWRPVELHMRFIRSVRTGESLTLELKHAEHEFFAILELSAEQRKRAGGGEERHEQEREQDKDSEIRALRKELERLRAENRELRKR